MFRRFLATTGALAMLCSFEAGASILTYDFSGNFANSHWNGEGNSNRVPGGEVAGSFTIDTVNGTLDQVNIDSAFYSIHGPQLLASQYRFGVTGETDDRIGTQTVTIGATNISGFSRNIGLTVDLTGNTSVDINGTAMTGSIIQILDVIGASTRVYYPRLTLFFAGIDLTQGLDQLTMMASEYVWNINRGTGRAGDSGSQDWGSIVASSDQTGAGSPDGSIPLPGALALLLTGLGVLVSQGRATRR